MPSTVVFACLHNAGRSQMAAAFFNQLADAGRARALSAGTQPASEVHPLVLDTMREAGIDLADARPRLLTSELVRGARLLVTMGCGESCPAVAGVSVEDWPFDDPEGRPADEVRRIRDEIRQRVAELVRRESWGPAG